jgi:hypothetical protein
MPVCRTAPPNDPLSAEHKTRLRDDKRHRQLSPAVRLIMVCQAAEAI